MCLTCCVPNMLNNARRNKYLERLVKSLKVCCSNYMEGCTWVGELKTYCSYCALACDNNGMMNIN